MKFFVSTGEISGDLHLSYLVNSMKKIDKNIEFYGVAGKHSEDVGVKIIQNIDELAIMGFSEAIKKYSFLKKKAYEYLEFIKENEIKKVIMVDYGGFNLKFLEILKKEIKDIEVYYYIPPKLWIWGEKRIEKLKLADHIVVIFPWEVDFYKKHNIDAIYYGNPFIDKYEKLERYGEKILLLPGSRKQEITKLLPILLEIVRNNLDENFILKLSKKEHLEWIKEDLSTYINLKVEIENSLEECIKTSKIAIATSGTVTLELALLGIPTIVIYKTTWLNYMIAKYILKVGFVSLPNLTLDKEVFPEMLQSKCNVIEIENKLSILSKNLEIIEKDMEKIREKLSNNGNKNIVDRLGEYFLKEKDEIKNI